MAETSPRTDTSTDVDTDDKNHTVIFHFAPLGISVVEVFECCNLILQFCSIFYKRNIKRKKNHFGT